MAGVAGEDVDIMQGFGTDVLGPRLTMWGKTGFALPPLDPLTHDLSAEYPYSCPPSMGHPARPEAPTKGGGTLPRIHYLVDEMTFHREQGSRVQQLETGLTQRGDEGWELVTIITPEAHTEDTSAGVRLLRSANLRLVFKRL
jgi:hypothetical protein